MAELQLTPEEQQRIYNLKQEINSINKLLQTTPLGENISIQLYDDKDHKYHNQSLTREDAVKRQEKDRQEIQKLEHQSFGKREHSNPLIAALAKLIETITNAFLYLFSPEYRASIKLGMEEARHEMYMGGRESADKTAPDKEEKKEKGEKEKSQDEREVEEDRKEPDPIKPQQKEMEEKAEKTEPADNIIKSDIKDLREKAAMEYQDMEAFYRLGRPGQGASIQDIRDYAEHRFDVQSKNNPDELAVGYVVKDVARQHPDALFLLEGALKDSKISKIETELKNGKTINILRNKMFHCENLIVTNPACAEYIPLKSMHMSVDQYIDSGLADKILQQSIRGNRKFSLKPDEILMTMKVDKPGTLADQKLYNAIKAAWCRENKIDPEDKSHENAVKFAQFYFDAPDADEKKLADLSLRSMFFTQAATGYRAKDPTVITEEELKAFRSRDAMLFDVLPDKVKQIVLEKEKQIQEEKTQEGKTTVKEEEKEFINQPKSVDEHTAAPETQKDMEAAKGDPEISAQTPEETANPENGIVKAQIKAAELTSDKTLMSFYTQAFAKTGGHNEVQDKDLGEQDAFKWLTGNYLKDHPDESQKFMKEVYPSLSDAEKTECAANVIPENPEVINTLTPEQVNAIPESVWKQMPAQDILNQQAETQQERIMYMNLHAAHPEAEFHKENLQFAIDKKTNKAIADIVFAKSDNSYIGQSNAEIAAKVILDADHRLPDVLQPENICSQKEFKDSKDLIYSAALANRIAQNQWEDVSKMYSDTIRQMKNSEKSAVIQLAAQHVAELDSRTPQTIDMSSRRQNLFSVMNKDAKKFGKTYDEQINQSPAIQKSAEEPEIAKMALPYPEHDIATNIDEPIVDNSQPNPFEDHLSQDVGDEVEIDENDYERSIYHDLPPIGPEEPQPSVLQKFTDHVKDTLQNSLDDMPDPIQMDREQDLFDREDEDEYH